MRNGGGQYNIKVTGTPATQPAMPPAMPPTRKRYVPGCACCTQTNGPQALVAQFSDASGGFTYDAEMIGLRRKLICEESGEATDELALFLAGQGSLKGLAKELADVLYVVYGTAHCFGIDLQRVFEEVHRSNMSKFPAVLREDGKVTKGPNYVEPDLSFVEES